MVIGLAKLLGPPIRLIIGEQKEGLWMDARARRRLITDFILENRELLYRLAFGYAQNTEDALDIVEDSIYKALSSEKSLVKPEAVRSWCCRIVVNSALDFQRRRRKQTVFSEDEMENAMPVTDKYQDFDLREALSKLPARNRTILGLRFYEDMKLPEIAEVLGENLSTVKTALYSSLEKLRLALSDVEDSTDTRG